MRCLRQPPLKATLVTLLGMAVLCGLGAWQLHRLHWKERILAEIRAAETVGRVPDLRYRDLEKLENDPRLFIPGQVRGVYRHDLSVRVGPRTYQGHAGVHILTPLALPGGGFILVNRGWLGLPEAAHDDPRGTVTVRGLLRHPEHPGPFVPENNPAKEEWYSAEPSQIARFRGLTDMAPVILYASAETGDAPVPVREALAYRPRNNHLSYAVFWFTMAGVLGVIYALRFVIVSRP